MSTNIEYCQNDRLTWPIDPSYNLAPPDGRALGPIDSSSRELYESLLEDWIIEHIHPSHQRHAEDDDSQGASQPPARSSTSSRSGSGTTSSWGGRRSSDNEGLRNA